MLFKKKILKTKTLKKKCFEYYLKFFLNHSVKIFTRRKISNFPCTKMNCRKILKILRKHILTNAPPGANGFPAGARSRGPTVEEVD